MRELKFRAWNIYHKKIYTVISINFKLGIVVCYNEENNTTREFGMIGVILLQYTGLKDKNKKEIWEGDIVKIDGHGIENYITDICWDEYLSGFYSKNLYESDTFEHSTRCIEVLGNIYENPELLEEK